MPEEKAQERPVPAGVGEHHSPRKLVVPGGKQSRWLTSGMTALVLVFGHFTGWPAEPTEEGSCGCGPRPKYLCPLAQRHAAVGLGHRCWGLVCFSSTWLRLGRRRLATEYPGCKHGLNANAPVLRGLLLRAVCYWASYLPLLSLFFSSVE